MQIYPNKYSKAEKFFREKLGYTQAEIDEMNAEDSEQLKSIVEAIAGINRNIRNTTRFENYNAFKSPFGD